MSLALGANPKVKQLSYAAVGAVLLGYASLSLGWLPPLFNTDVNPLLSFSRNSDAGILLGRISIVISTGILISQWLVLGSNIRKGIENQRLLWQLFAIWTAPMLLAPAIFSRDVYSYIAQGRLVLAGFNPYTDGVSIVPGWFHLGVDPMWATTPTPYGPIWIGLEALTVWLTPDSPFWSLVIFRLISLIALIVMAIGIIKIAQHYEVSPSLALWLSLSNPLTLFHLIGAIHNDSLMITLMVWGFYFSIRKKFLFAILFILAASLIKPIALLALPIVMLEPNLRFSEKIRRWAYCGAFTLLALWSIGQISTYGFDWIKALLTPGQVLTLLSPSSTLGYLTGIVAESLGIGTTATFTAISRFVIFALALAIIATYLIQTRAENVVRVGAYVFALIVIASPVIQPWYLLWALALVAPIGIRSVLHLRLIVFSTVFLVAYSTIEVEVARDFNLSAGDFIAVASVIVMMLLTFVSSKVARGLVRDFSAGNP
jgi:hypothetical protein